MTNKKIVKFLSLNKTTLKNLSSIEHNKIIKKLTIKAKNIYCSWILIK